VIVLAGTVNVAAASPTDETDGPPTTEYQVAEEPELAVVGIAMLTTPVEVLAREPVDVFVFVVEPVEPVEPVGPVEPVESVGPVESVEPVEAAEIE